MWHGRGRAEERLEPVRARPRGAVLARALVVAALLATAATAAWAGAAGGGGAGGEIDPRGESGVAGALSGSGGPDGSSGSSGPGALSGSDDPDGSSGSSGPGALSGGGAPGGPSGSSGPGALSGGGAPGGPSGSGGPGSAGGPGDGGDPRGGSRAAGARGSPQVCGGVQAGAGACGDARTPVPPGLVGVPVRMADPTALAMVGAGDRVDLLVVRDGGRTEPVAENALVLAVTGADDPLAGGMLLALDRAAAKRAVAAPERGYAVLLRPG